MALPAVDESYELPRSVSELQQKSCQTYFRRWMECHSPANMSEIYRHGKLQTCDRQWENVQFCMRAKLLSNSSSLQDELQIINRRRTSTQRELQVTHVWKWRTNPPDDFKQWKPRNDDDYAVTVAKT